MPHPPRRAGRVRVLVIFAPVGGMWLNAWLVPMLGIGDIGELPLSSRSPAPTVGSLSAASG